MFLRSWNNWSHEELTRWFFEKIELGHVSWKPKIGSIKKVSCFYKYEFWKNQNCGFYKKSHNHPHGFKPVVLYKIK